MLQKIKARFKQPAGTNTFIILRWCRIRGKGRWVFLRWMEKYKPGAEMLRHD